MCLSQIEHTVQQRGRTVEKDLPVLQKIQVVNVASSALLLEIINQRLMNKRGQSKSHRERHAL